ncbi:MAG: aminotransferase class III-fold pyridoxal phosphate-dependent enzyme [Candidatus Marsarchaeota archaeon]|nr:aminotransferase class III-fold pyridoxal phosphate-dependent enzyme [Candidatus Marsarchaeota archaeon]MCL5112445.1 aminotransferase class III-fold pyridoxal phosphate-dependent enzyme [Candidatus Marsarchaeota archaeon]
MAEVKITKKSMDVIARDSKVMITTTRESYPFVADHANGDFVYDIDGNRFIDFSTFIAVYTMGENGLPEVRRAVKEQVDKLMHSAFTDFYAELPVRFTESLLKMFPSGFGRVFLSNSGTEANEAALKFARLFTKRQYMLAFYGAFHGRSKGSLALTASNFVQRSSFGPYSDTVHVPFAYCYRCPFKQTYPECGFACVDYIKKYPLSKEMNPKDVAAMIVEPIQGEGGYIVPPKDYFKELKSLLDESGILLISDEVQAGYMRTGKFLAMDNFGVTADIYTMAKALGAGLPLGATITRKSLGDIPKGAHASTFGGNLVSVAAANASLSHLKRNANSIKRQIASKSRIIMKRLNSMKERYEIIGDVRGIGLMIGVELVRDKRTKMPAMKERESILGECFANGLLLLPAGTSTIRIIPAATISVEHLEKGLDIFEDAVAHADKGMRRSSRS